MDVILIPLLSLAIKIIDLYIWGVIIGVIMGVLTTYGVINPYNQFVSVVGGFLDRITDPLLNPIRNIIPNLGSIDISPIVLILALHFIQDILGRLAFHMMPHTLPLP